MCLIVLSWQPDTATPLILAANRDEYHARPAAPAHWWPDGDILAGRDLQAGGTWMGLGRAGRFAAITNVRDPRRHRADARSRGLLVSNFLGARQSPVDYLTDVAQQAAEYNGFNLLVGEVGKAQSLAYLHAGETSPRTLDAGLYGLSNASLDTPWPKVEGAKSALQEVLQAKMSHEARQSALFSFLSNTDAAADGRLPDTGIGIERERLLSAACIVSPSYGTRSSTTLVVTADQMRMEERTLDPDSRVSSVVTETIPLY